MMSKPTRKFFITLICMGLLSSCSLSSMESSGDHSYEAKPTYVSEVPERSASLFLSGESTKKKEMYEKASTPPAPAPAPAPKAAVAPPKDAEEPMPKLVMKPISLELIGHSDQPVNDALTDRGISSITTRKPNKINDFKRDSLGYDSESKRRSGRNDASLKTEIEEEKEEEDDDEAEAEDGIADKDQKVYQPQELSYIPLIQALKTHLTKSKPNHFWPKKGYFTNTYLGGNLNFMGQLKNANSHIKGLVNTIQNKQYQHPLDLPLDSGMNLEVSATQQILTKPGRMIMRVALKGSQRYGWRRPALNLMLLVDPSLLQTNSSLSIQDQCIKYILPLIQKLDPIDQAGIMMGELVISPRSSHALRQALIQPRIQINHWQEHHWNQGFDRIQTELEYLANDPHQVPGTQTLLLVCGTGCQQYQSLIQKKVHHLNTAGILTTVIKDRPVVHHHAEQTLRQIAQAGHGGYWGVDHDMSYSQVIQAEFDRFARVVARLLRINIRLSKHVELIDIWGSQLLNQQQAQKVKAREVAMDRRLSQRLGIKSDRGEDDDGLQVVIPAFYGGDSHFIHLELWAEKAGQVAEVSLKYKDMVRTQNASHTTSLSLYNYQASPYIRHDVWNSASLHWLATQLQQHLMSGQSHTLITWQTLFTQVYHMGFDVEDEHILNLILQASLGGGLQSSVAL